MNLSAIKSRFEGVYFDTEARALAHGFVRVREGEGMAGRYGPCSTPLWEVKARHLVDDRYGFVGPYNGPSVLYAAPDLAAALLYAGLTGQLAALDVILRRLDAETALRDRIAEVALLAGAHAGAMALVAAVVR